MPLLVLCGLPASGKSTLARLLQEQIADRKVYVVSDDDEHGATRADMYRSSTDEKRTRSLFKASIQRHLTNQSVVIADSLNYIKGYRYELFCVARELGTQLVLVYCVTSHAEAKLRNSRRREAGEDSYEDEALNGLLIRFEVPNEMNRWERPLFLADNTDRNKESFGLDLQHVVDALSDTKQALRPNQATARPEVQSTDSLQLLDRAMNQVEKSVLDRIAYLVEGDELSVPPASTKLVIRRIPTAAEIRKHRRAYMKLAHFHPPTSQSLEQIANEYVDHLNAQLRT